MKKLGIGLIVLGVLGLGYQITKGVFVNYKWSNSFGSYWSLAEKASTIEKKSEYIDKFVSELEKSGTMVGHNAIFLKTPDNSLEANMITLKTLQQRLEEIKGMDVKSFEYQQAIQQITAQEQGEADTMIGVLHQGWILHSSFWVVWCWLAAIFALVMLSIITTGIVFLNKYYEEN